MDAPVVAPVAGDGVIDTIAELKDALEADGEVVLGGSIAYDDRVDIVITKPVTLDLNGFTVTENYGGINHFMMVIRDGGSLTLKDSKGNGKLCATDSSYGYGIQLFSNSKFIMTGGTIETTQESVDIYTGATNVDVKISGGRIYASTDSALNVRGGSDVSVEVTGGEIESKGNEAFFISANRTNSATVKISGGSVVSDDYPIYMDGGANLIVEGDALIKTTGSNGAIRAASDGEWEASTVTINGGTLVGDYHCVTIDYKSTILTITGGKLTSDRSSVVELAGEAVMEMSGGTLTSNKSAGVSVGESASAKITGGIVEAADNSPAVDVKNADGLSVSGGKFSSELDKQYLDESVKAVVKNESGQVSYHQSIDDAVANAGKDDEIVIPNDSTSTKFEVTFAFNDGTGKTVVINAGAAIELPSPRRDGYTFKGWYGPDGAQVASPYTPVSIITLAAQWEINYVPPVITPPTKNDVEIPAVEGGKIAAKPASAEKGDKVTLTVTPDAGQELRELKATDGAGKAIELTENEDGTFTFTMPDGDVEISAVFGCDGGDLCISHKFPDFDADEWYHDSMDWAIENGYLKGFDDDGTIRPYGKATRAQVVAVLARIAGVDEDKYKSSGFADVSDSDWHARVVAWAAENGIVEGYGDGTYFGPDDPVTREQLAVILMRFAAFQGKDVTGRGDLEFPDAGSANDWALDALSWAVSEGLILGDDTTGELNPIDGSARAELVAILMRYMS